MKTGIVILNYHSKKMTEDLAKTLATYSVIDYIVIVDNFSGEDFSELAENEEKIIFIANDKNEGYAKGNNIGLRYLYQEKKCHFAFIANPDVIVFEETIKNIVEFLNLHKDYAVVSSKRYSIYGNKMGQYWARPTYRECLFEALGLYRKHLAKNYAINTTKLAFENPPPENYITVEVVPGAFFGMNLSAVAEVDYLDEETFLYYEENILSAKLKDKGYKNAILTNCVYEHNHNHKTKGLGNKHYKAYLKSKTHYARKYLHCGKFKMFWLRIGNFLYTLEVKAKAILKR